MVKSAFSILAVAAVGGFMLAPGIASAATDGPAVLAQSFTQAGGDPTTTVTFTVTSGLLSMTAPDSVDLGSGAPGTTISGPLGGTTAGPSVVVTDDRAALDATWIVTASSTSFTTGGGTPRETIPPGDVTYDPGTITTTGTITATGTTITLSGTSQAVVTGTAGSGNNTASWNPILSVHVPASAVAGLYTGTLTQTVS